MLPHSPIGWSPKRLQDELNNTTPWPWDGERRMHVRGKVSPCMIFKCPQLLDLAKLVESSALEPNRRSPQFGYLLRLASIRTISLDVDLLASDCDAQQFLYETSRDVYATLGRAFEEFGDLIDDYC